MDASTTPTQSNTPAPLPAPAALLAQLDAALSSDALRTLCLRLAVDPDNLAGETKQGRARELIAGMERRGRYAELVAAFQRLVLEAAPRYLAGAAPLIVELALARLAALPLDTIPAPAALPLGSRMPFASNPLPPFLWLSRSTLRQRGT